MSKTRAARSASAAAAIGLLKRLGLDIRRATEPHAHDSPAQRRRRGRTGRA